MTTIKKSTVWVYGSIGLPLAMIGYPIGTFLPDLYAGNMGVPLATVGILISLSGFFDAVTDPFMGFASDATRTRWGRRKPWIFVGAPLVLLGFYMLVNPSPGVTGVYLVVWMCCLYLGTTLLGMPYSAWGAELFNEYHLRTMVQSARERYVLIGLMSSALFVAMARLYLPEGTNGLEYLAWMLLLIMPVTVGSALWYVPEPGVVIVKRRVTLRESFSLMYRNGLFRWLLLIEILITASENFRNAMSLFFIRDYIGVDPKLLAFYYVLYFACGFLFVPIWDWLSQRFGKHNALAIAMVAVSVINVLTFFLSYGAILAYVVLFALKGLCFGAFAYLPRSMLADVVDVDTARSGDARPGSYFAVHGVITKGVGRLGSGIGLVILGYVGFIADKKLLAEGATNGPTEMLWLGVLYTIIPTILFMIACYFCMTYPLTSERHARFRKRLDRRNAMLLEKKENAG